MKRALILLGISFLVLIVFVAAAVAYMALRGPVLDASSKAFVDKNVPILVSDWSKQSFQKVASTEFQKAISMQPWDLYLNRAKRLGKFEQYEGSEGKAYTSLTFQRGLTILADYTATVSFQNGTAEISVELVRRRDHWELSRFDVNSPILAK